MKSLTNTGKQITLDVAQTLLYYKSYPEVDKDWPPSGAYIFRSANDTVYPLSDAAQITVVQVGEWNWFMAALCNICKKNLSV